MNIKGIIEIHIKDKDTLETIEVIEAFNVITDFTIAARFMSPNNSQYPLGPYIGISSDISPQIREYSAGATTANSPTLAAGYVSAGVVSPLWVEKAGATPQYVQFQNRFDPPTATRTINTVFLSDMSGLGGAYNYQAYTLLTTTCTQTTTQVLDVYYRVQFPYSSITGIAETTYRQMARWWVGYTADVVKLTGVSSNVLPIPPASQLGKVGLALDGDNALCVWSGGGYFQGPAQISTTIGQFYKNTISYGYDAATYVGRIFNVMTMNTGMPNTLTTPISWSSLNIASQIQPLFNHTAAAVGPFLDVNTLASGSGSVVASGAWTVPQYPELYAINIGTTGNIGTGTYNFSKRRHMGFYGNTFNDRLETIPALTISKVGDKCALVHGLQSDANLDAALKYNSTTVLYFDATGVTKYDLVNGVMTNFDATSTPALPVTAVTQVCVGTDGSIWVACTATGLWQISADNLTVTHNLSSTGVTNTSCYGVDIGNAGAICAVFNGGYCISTNNGVAWTTYNSGTTPAFTATGITDANWNSIKYIRVDPASSTFNTLFIRQWGTVVNQTLGSVWWNTTGTSASGPSTFLMRSYIDTCNVSNNNSFWACSHSPFPGAPIVYSMTYGAATLFAVYTGTAWNETITTRLPSISSIQFELNSAGADALLIIYNTEGYAYGNPGYGNPVATLYNSNGTSMAALSFASKNYNAGAQAGGQYPNALYGALFNYINLGNGMIFGRVNPRQGYGSFAGTTYQGAVLFNWASDSTRSGGTYGYVAWDNYGWTGTAWALNNTGTKATHTGAAPLINGISVAFVDGTSSGINSFVATDYYTFGVNQGILKDNATTFTYSNGLYYKPIVASTDFNTSTITSVTGTVGAPVWRTPSANITIDGTNRLVTLAAVNSYYSIGAQSTTRLIGDFQVDFTNLAGVTNFIVGVGLNNQTNYFDYVDTTPYSPAGIGNGSFLYNFAINAGQFSVLLVGGVTNPFYRGAMTAPNTTVSIQRVGSVIYYKNNGVTVYTLTGANTGPLRITMGTTARGVAGPYTSPVATISANGTIPMTVLGNPSTLTGSYDAGFIAVETASPGLTQISLNGVPAATTYRITGTTLPTSPNIGEVAVYSNDGIAVFHTADVGKTVSGTYSYMKNI